MSLRDHLATGLTTVCRCWAVTRGDGTVYGFTDHDLPLEFDGISFRANGGMSASALVQGSGLSVDNSEALGVLSDAAISEQEIEQGRFDNAEVRAWLVNWTDVSERVVQFAGHLGEIQRSGGAFQAELRGLTERLNQPQGRVFQRSCSAVLGDAECRVNTQDPAFSAVVAVDEVERAQVFNFVGAGQFADRWLERGLLEVLTGEGEGLSGVIKHDRLLAAGARRVELWEPIRADVRIGDSVRLIAGCDKRAATCRDKFANFVNFRGFPYIPGEDWLVSVPRGAGDEDGGSLGG